MKKPLTLELITIKNNLYLIPKFDIQYSKNEAILFRYKNAILLRYPFIRMKKSKDLTLYLLPESKIKITNHKNAEEFIKGILPFCDSTKGLEAIGITTSIVNSKPNIPIMMFKGEAK